MLHRSCLGSRGKAFSSDGILLCPFEDHYWPMKTVGEVTVSEGDRRRLREPWACAANPMPTSPVGDWRPPYAVSVVAKPCDMIGTYLTILFILSLLVNFTHDLVAQDSSLRNEHLFVIKGTPLEQEYQEMLFKYLLRQTDRATQSRVARLESLHSEGDFRFSKDGSGRRPAIVYLRDRGGEQDTPEVYEGLVRAGRVVGVADVRGFGETMSARNVPDTRMDYFHARDGMEATFTYASFFLGRAILGMRVWDGLQVVEYVCSRPDVDAKQISLIGRGWAGTVSLFVAALDSRIGCLAVEEIPASYAEIARSEDYAQPVSSMLPGVLEDFDLSDIFSAIVPRRLLVLNPVDVLTKKMVWEEARQALNPVRYAYQTAHTPAAFEVRVDPEERQIFEAIKRWIYTGRH
jgi:hypothetical protein